MERFQDKAVKELRTYVTQTWNEEAEDRFPRLLLRLPPLRSLQPGLMEELFFAALIGTVHIDSVIPYILRMDSTEYNGQFGKNYLDQVVKPQNTFLEFFFFFFGSHAVHIYRVLNVFLLYPD